MAKIRIGYTGCPGCGKTTLSRAFTGAVRAAIPEIQTVELVAEYARVYIKEYGVPDLTGQFLILDKQQSREDAYQTNLDLLVTDSPLWLGLAYANRLLREGHVTDHKIYRELFKKMEKLNIVPRYDIIFHLPPTVKPVNDGIRSKEQLDQAWREDFDQDICAVFRLLRPRQFITLNSVSTDDRVKECVRHLKSYINKT